MNIIIFNMKFPVELNFNKIHKHYTFWKMWTVYNKLKITLKLMEI